MDIEKLIEVLRQRGVAYVRAYGRYCSICDEVVTALSTLQAENEKLREKIEDARLEGYTKGLGEMSEENERLWAELENYRRGHCSEGGCAAEKDRDDALAELEQVKRKRDAAVEGLRVCSIENNMECQYCLYRTARSFCWNCTDGSNWKFRGQKED